MKQSKTQSKNKFHKELKNKELCIYKKSQTKQQKHSGFTWHCSILIESLSFSWKKKISCVNTFNFFLS